MDKIINYTSKEYDTSELTDDSEYDTYNSTSSADPHTRINFILSLMLLFVAARFGIELYSCFKQCCKYTKDKMHIVRDNNRILSMKLTDDNLQDLLLTDCSICLERFVIGDTVKILPCYHNFHSTCVEEWLLSHHNCPMCRNDISENI